MRAQAFLDTNILLRHLLADHPEHSPAATRLIVAIEAGELVVRITDTVVFETVFTSEKTYGVSREQIEAMLLPILELPGVVLPGKSALPEVFGLWTSRRGLSFADCFHLVMTKRFGLSEIISFDRRLSGIAGVTRREPALD